MTVIIDGIKSLSGGLDVTSVEGITSLYTVFGIERSEYIHLDVNGIALTTGFMLVDLSDTTNWPHSATGHIDLLYMTVNIDPDASFQGDIFIGFLENVDGTDGDFHTIFSYQLDKKAEPLVSFMNFNSFEMTLMPARWFGPTTANDTTWQTDVNLVGPDGNASFPAGDGDLVVKVVRTAGEVSVGITVGYETYS